MFNVNRYNCCTLQVVEEVHGTDNIDVVFHAAFIGTIFFLVFELVVVVLIFFTILDSTNMLSFEFNRRFEILLKVRTHQKFLMLLFLYLADVLSAFLYPNGMWRHFLMALPFIKRPYPRALPGLWRRHVMTVAITTACRDATYSANLHANFCAKHICKHLRS